MTWTETVEPLVNKCRLGATLNARIIFQPADATALADILEQIAKALDSINQRAANSSPPRACHASTTLSGLTAPPPCGGDTWNEVTIMRVMRRLGIRGR
jgi:hypothetical protein